MRFLNCPNPKKGFSLISKACDINVLRTCFASRDVKFSRSLAKPCQGFSLIEVIIAVFITGAIVLVIANIPQVIRMVTGSQSELKVREVVAKKVEDLRLSGYDNLANGTTPVSDVKLSGLNGMSGNVLISDCPPELCSSGELAKQVSITITWTESREPKRFSITTLIAKGGLR